MGRRVKEELRINGVIYALEVHQNDENLPYLLMLHGFMGDSRVFHHLIGNLSEACNPVTIDLLGHGQSEKIYEPERYQENQQVKDIIQLVQQLGLSPVFLYGYSMGGRLALKVALREPLLFKGLILESTNPGIVNSDDRAKRKKVDLNRAQNIGEDYERFLQKWEKAALFQPPIKPRHKLSKIYEMIHLKQDPKAMAASLRGFGTGFMIPIQNSMVNYSEPVLLLAGSGDEKYLKIVIEMNDFFKNGSIRSIEAGHRVHLDNPQELTEQITFFINKNTYL